MFSRFNPELFAPAIAETLAIAQMFNIQPPHVKPPANDEISKTLAEETNEHSRYLKDIISHAKENITDFSHALSNVHNYYKTSDQSKKEILTNYSQRPAIEPIHFTHQSAELPTVTAIKPTTPAPEPTRDDPEPHAIILETTGDKGTSLANHIATWQAYQLELATALGAVTIIPEHITSSWESATAPIILERIAILEAWTTELATQIQQHITITEKKLAAYTTISLSHPKTAQIQEVKQRIQTLQTAIQAGQTELEPELEEAQNELEQLTNLSLTLRTAYHAAS